MSRLRVPPIVSTAWLKQKLSTSDSRFRLLDATWNALVSGPEPYLTEHIPGALFFDLNRCIKPKPTCARNLPEADCFQEYAQSLGISNDTHVVIYDRTSIHASTKAWWTFRTFGHQYVSVLDGGMKKWKADNLDLASGEELCTQSGDFKVKLDRSLIAEFQDVVDNLKHKSSQVVDTRMLMNFMGQMKEPSIFTEKGQESMNMPCPQNMHAGHIPGSLHLYKSAVLDKSTNCFLSKDKLLTLFSENGIDPDNPLITTCYMGHSATLINMAAYICGNLDTNKLYHGSWTEYGQLATLDIVECPYQEDPEIISDPDKSKL